MIDNFLLLYYPQKDLSYIDGLRRPLYPKEEFHELYSRIQRPLLNLSVRRISEVYPKSNIHILTDNEVVLSGTGRNICLHVVENLPRNHLAKLRIYGLLDEPCMYMDTDVLLNRKFTREELAHTGRFKMFQGSQMKKIATYLGESEFTLYNAGIIWIEHPGQDLVAEFEKIQNDVFSDISKLQQYKLNENVDEFSVSYWCKKKGIFMDNSDTVGVRRSDVVAEELLNYQSVHYIHLRYKLMLAGEHRQLYPIKHL